MADITKITIKDRTGRIRGWIKIDSNGNKTATDHTGRIVGYYKVSLNATTEPTGQIYAWGDVVSSLIPA